MKFSVIAMIAVLYGAGHAFASQLPTKLGSPAGSRNARPRSCPGLLQRCRVDAAGMTHDPSSPGTLPTSQVSMFMGGADV